MTERLDRPAGLAILGIGLLVVAIDAAILMPVGAHGPAGHGSHLLAIVGMVAIIAAVAWRAVAGSGAAVSSHEGRDRDAVR
jgi:hypothetical protein